MPRTDGIDDDVTLHVKHSIGILIKEALMSDVAKECSGTIDDSELELDLIDDSDKKLVDNLDLIDSNNSLD